LPNHRMTLGKANRDRGFPLMVIFKNEDDH
jgi:hypothetical protein